MNPLTTISSAVQYFNKTIVEIGCPTLSIEASAPLPPADYNPLSPTTPSFSYQQNFLNALTVGAATALATQDSKVSLLVSFLSLFQPSESLKTDFKMDVGNINNNESAKTNALAKKLLETVPITIISPLPDMKLEIGSSLNFPIDFRRYCKPSNPSRNLEISIQRSDGTAPPDWISLNFGELTLDGSLDVGGQITYIGLSNKFAYTTALGRNKIYNLTNPSIPTFATEFIDEGYLYVKENYAFTLSNELRVYDISSPLNPTLVNNITLDSVYSLLYGNGNTLILCPGFGNDYLRIDVSNPLDLIISNPISVGSNPWVSVAANDKLFVVDTNLPNSYIIDASNSTNPQIISQFDHSDYSYAMNIENGYLFRMTGQTLQIYDIHQIASPVLVKTIPLKIYAVSSTLAGNYLFAFGWTNAQNFMLNVIDISDVSKAQVVATFDTFGAGTSFYGSLLTLSGNELFIGDANAGITTVYAGKRVLSGTPGKEDRGLLLLNVLIKDDANNTVVDPIVIHIGDINVANPIPNQQVYAGNSTLFTFDSGTFDYPNANFTYSAKLFEDLPLPPFINFDAESQTFLFTPQSGDQNTYRIQVTANDGLGGMQSTSFDLIVPNRPPTLDHPIADQVAYTSIPFDYIVASNAFHDAEDLLNFSARMVGSASLPGWLSFDSTARRFYGTPFGKGVYPIEITANDKNGGVVKDYFTITVPNSAPIVLNPIGTKIVSIGVPFTFTFNSNTFYDVDNDVLTYTVDTLPSFLTFNNTTRTFSGMPTILDVGSYPIGLHAQDPSGEETTHNFTFTVISSTNNLPPILVREIPDYNAKSQEPFSFSFSAKTFEDPENQPLTFVAELEGGNPLPAGLYFDSDTRTLSGQIDQPQSLRITIRAIDNFGAFALDTFVLTVSDSTNYPPMVLNPLSDDTATVGIKFNKQVPIDTFKDLNGDTLTITALQSNGGPLPKWLKWMPESMLFTGKPGPFDTGTYTDEKYSIDVWASDGIGKAKTSFNLTVQGESFWETFIKAGVSIASVAASGYGLWKARAVIWNRFSNSYKKGEERGFVNQSYEHVINIDATEVQAVKAFRNGFPLSQGKFLPEGIEYRNKKIFGTPFLKTVGHYTIRVTDHDGYIREEFNLLIKNDVNDPDPKPEFKKSFFDNFHPRECLQDAKQSCINATKSTQNFLIKRLREPSNQENQE